MAETCPFSETLRCRDETEILGLQDRDEIDTLKIMYRDQECFARSDKLHVTIN